MLNGEWSGIMRLHQQVITTRAARTGLARAGVPRSTVEAQHARNPRKNTINKHAAVTDRTSSVSLPPQALDPSDAGAAAPALSSRRFSQHGACEPQTFPVAAAACPGQQWSAGAAH